MPLESVSNRWLGRSKLGVQLQEEDVTSQGAFDRMAVGVVEAWKYSGFIAVGEFLYENAYERVFDPPKEEDYIDGEQANAQFGLSDTDYAFDPKKRVTFSEGEEVRQRMVEVEHQEALDKAAREDGKWVGISNFVGGFFGGILDPLNLVGGAAINMGVKSSAIAMRGVVNAGNASKVVRAMQGSVNKGTSWLLGQKSLGAQVAQEAGEGFIGGLAIDLPATSYMSCLLYTSPSPRDS